MDTKKQSFLKKINVYYFKLGTKLFLVYFTLLITSLFVTSQIGINFLKKYIEKSSYEKLYQITETKQKIIDKEFAAFQNEFKDFINDDFIEKATDLKDAYNEFELENHLVSIDKIKSSLSEYYRNEVVGEIFWNTPDLDDIFPKTDKEIVFQYVYIANNGYPKDEKDKYLGPDDYSSYSSVHKEFHPLVRKFTQEHKLNNLYLVDNETGNIYYNFNKNIALSSNLFTGTYKHSPLSTIFHRSLSDNDESVMISDYTHFIPNDNKAVGFIAFPVSIYGIKKAIVIIETDPEFYQNLYLDKWMLHEKESITLNLIGDDHLLRTNDVEYLINPEEFLLNMSNKGRWSDKYKGVADLKSCALLLGYSPELHLDKSAIVFSRDYFGDNAYILSLPVKIGDLTWHLVSQSSLSKSHAFLYKLRWVILVVFIALLGVAYFVFYKVSRSIAKRLKRLHKSIQNTTKGKQTSDIKILWKDELGDAMKEFNTLKNRVNKAGDFAFALSEGNFEGEFKSESEDDRFAKALNTLNEKLKSNKKETEKREVKDKIQVWINEGIAKFNDLLRQSNDNIVQLSYLIIENLIEYLGANLGGIFLVEGENEERKVIKLVASYAYDRRKYMKTSIEIGEGLIGNCYLEKKPIHLKNIPQDYMEIASGLGKTSPKVLYIVPLMIDDNVLGFIELASIEDFEKHKINFINRLADNIAATFSTVKLNTRTAELLEESKKRASEIAQQEEEMRQNLEEMHATQEELSRIRAEDEKKTTSLSQEIEAAHRMIQQLLNSMDGEVLLKDSQGVIVLANEEAAYRFNTTPDKFRGMSDNELFTPEKAQREHEIDLQVLKEGIHTEESIELVGNEDVKYFIVKKQFFLPNRKEAGILTIRNKRQ